MGNSIDIKGAKKLLNTAKSKAEDILTDAVKSKTAELRSELAEMKKDIDEKGYSDKAAQVTRQLIVKLSSVPVVRVDRDDFLRKTFGASPYIDEILAHGPQYVYSADALRLKADEIIKSSTRKTSVASFAAGLPSNVAVVAATTAADVAQYFGFALNMAQKIAYLFGEDQLFDSYDPSDDMISRDGQSLPEDAQARIIAYLGVMLGISGASGLILKTAHTAGAAIGKKTAAKALTKTAWYPIVKKVASNLGIKITKQTFSGAVTKAVPVVGGIVSGALTYSTFRPMGGRLTEVFIKLLNGEYTDELELNPEFVKKLEEIEKTESEAIDAQFIECDEAEV